MNILVVGLNHKTAGVDVREKLAFNGPKLEEGLQRIKTIPYVKEAVILSTCNRVEMYANVDNPQKAYESIKDFLSEFHGIERDSLETALYTHEDTNAVKHIFRVASSLDSMVVGEPQILGQIKDAFEFSLQKKTTGILLNKLMKKAISVAKRIRTETKIAENAVSISFAAVELAKKYLQTFQQNHSCFSAQETWQSLQRGISLTAGSGTSLSRTEPMRQGANLQENLTAGL